MNRCEHKRLIEHVVPHVGTLRRCADCHKKVGDRVARAGRSGFKRTHSKLVAEATVVERIVQQCDLNCPEHGSRDR